MARERGANERPEAEEEQEGSRAGRIAALAALVLVVGFAVYLLLFAGDEYEVTAEFENASQLVEGNEVTLAGASIGSIKEIELGDRGGALVTFSVEEEFSPLPRGTRATARSFSLSGIANRQVQLTLPPERDGEPAPEEIPDGGRMTRQETVSEVDLDELFNTLDDRTVRNLKKVIEGFEVSYDGVGRQANRGLRFFNPFLSTSRRLFGELNRDERALASLIVDTSRLSGALAERAPDIELLVGNLNRMMGALASRKAELATSIRELPGFMRRANTTFVNLRAALDDVDPLVDASKPVARKLRPFLADLRTTARGAVPTIRDLDRIIAQRGRENDLVELTRLQPPLARAALGSGRPDCGEDPETDFSDAADGDFTQGAFGEAVCSLRNGLPGLAFFRAYTPELVGWLDGFGHPNVVDANGPIGRIGLTLNAFTVSPITTLPDLLAPLTPGQIQNALTTGYFNKCPGANERPADNGGVPFLDGSTPFTDPLNCDPTQTAPGP